MGNFLVIASADELEDQANALFQIGLSVGHHSKSQVANQVVQSGWARAAVFPRRKGLSSIAVSDPATGSWLMAVGTWFHARRLWPRSRASIARPVFAVRS